MIKRTTVSCVLFLSLQAIAFAQQNDAAAWSRATGGDTKLDPATTVNSTTFLLSLNDVEREGAFLFLQRCNACHRSLDSYGYGPGSPLSIGPTLSKKQVENEQAARQRIMQGSARMPAFRHGLQPPQVDAIIAYLKRVNP